VQSDAFDFSVLFNHMYNRSSGVTCSCICSITLSSFVSDLFHVVFIVLRQMQHGNGMVWHCLVCVCGSLQSVCWNISFSISLGKIFPC
jgi:hypothetical protein